LCEGSGAEVKDRNEKDRRKLHIKQAYLQSHISHAPRLPTFQIGVPNLVGEEQAMKTADDQPLTLSCMNKH
jgi:hypothetical protein